MAGNDAYDVRLSFGDGRRGVRGDCSCPFGEEGNFCKHCVAAGLVALKRGGNRPGAMPATHAGRQALVSWLSSLTKDELLAELIEIVDADPDLRRRLELRAAGQRTDVDGIRDAVLNLLWVNDYIDYDGAGDYANDITRAAEAIGELVEAGAGTQAIEVARDAIDWLRESLRMVDDSSGDAASAAYELLDAHLLACEAAPPDPVELAGYLAELWLTDQSGLVPALTDYAELLGDTGATALRERVTAAHEADPGNSQVRHVLESVLEAGNDVNALVALYAANLDQFGWQYLRIAQTLDEAGRAGESLAWAERGARDCPRPNERLVAYLAARYTADGRAGDVLELRRTYFAADRTLASYQALREAALDAGAWDAEREAALGLLRQDAAAVQGTLWWPWAGPVLVDVLIDDGDLEAAWAIAQDVASERQWVRLADASVTDRPADALAVYVKIIERLTQHTGDDIYRQITEHLTRARACHQALGTTDEFQRHMALLRTANKRKRNLMKLLDKSGL
ncbi:MAG TPA: SWIM zinc finger family protein [Trebonia sp.]|nr:SWIM zinc finger family protein [Trebonia sp.]